MEVKNPPQLKRLFSKLAVFVSRENSGDNSLFQIFNSRTIDEHFRNLRMSIIYSASNRIYNHPNLVRMAGFLELKERLPDENDIIEIRFKGKEFINRNSNGFPFHTQCRIIVHPKIKL